MEKKKEVKIKMENKLKMVHRNRELDLLLPILLLRNSKIWDFWSATVNGWNQRPKK